MKNGFLLDRLIDFRSLDYTYGEEEAEESNDGIA